MFDIEGLLQSWAVDEIAQFTDFLFHDNFMEKVGTLVNNVPSYFLKPNRTYITGEEIFMPLFETVPIVPCSKKQTLRNRHHDIDKRRFYPKRMKRS